MLTGYNRSPRPSLGSWLLYGLGSENENLPGFVVMGGGNRIGGKGHASNFLPEVRPNRTLPPRLRPRRTSR